MSDCYEGTAVPIKSENKCLGVYTSSECIIHSAAITALNLPVNSSIKDIVNALVLAILYKDEQIAELIERVEILETP